jgi:hypothetical protein
VANGGSGLAFPFVGVGGYEQVLSVKNATRLDVIESYGGADTIYQFGAVVRVGMSYCFPLRSGESAAGAFGFFAGGVSGGATIDLGRTGWRVDRDKEVRGGPDLPMHTFFLHVDLAFGGGTTAIY